MFIQSADMDEAARHLADTLRAKGWRMACAESCTGGLVAAACTSLAGSSDWFDRGFVTYSNEAKAEMLGVDMALITRHGAVSEPVVRAMALGALARSAAQLTVAISGVAGPGGGSAAKPVGTVWLAWARGERVQTRLVHLPGDRTAVRVASAVIALRDLHAMTLDA